MTQEKFKKLVGEALDDLPYEFAKYLDNVEVTVSDWPTPKEQILVGHGLLFGLYRGIPKTRRGLSYSMVLPDKITIFKGPIELVHKSPEAIKLQVRKTVIHEIAHHFGISDERLREIGI